MDLSLIFQRPLITLLTLAQRASKERAEFGDVFATSPLQNASSSIGSGTILKVLSNNLRRKHLIISKRA